MRIQGYSFRLLGGLLLLAWGVLLALHGLGVSHLPVGQLINTWWPAPFVLWGLVGIVTSLFQGGRGVFWNLLVAVLFAVLLLGNLGFAHLNGWTIFWAIVVLGLGFEMLRGPGWISSGTGWHRRPDGMTIRFGGGSRRHGMRSEGHLIGDVHLDLSQEPLSEGETPYDLSAMIGDITVLVPQDVAISIDAEVMLGDLTVFGRTQEGIRRQVHYESPGYAESAKRVHIMAHLMIGDITVQQF